MTKKLAAPFVKWAGGKRQLMAEIESRVPSSFKTYYEPFAGGAAVLWHLAPKSAVISDANSELINAYRVVRDSPLELIESMARHVNEKGYFMRLRETDRHPKIFRSLTDVDRASRLLYLNATCFNGLYRVNKSGQFNVPFGKYENPNIVKEDAIMAAHAYLASNRVTIMNASYLTCLWTADSDSFVYLDPPYYEASKTANFSAYTAGGFREGDQAALKVCCDALHANGVKFLLSNSATTFTMELYREYDISVVKAKRSVNSKGGARGKVGEILVKNY